MASCVGARLQYARRGPKRRDLHVAGIGNSFLEVSARFPLVVSRVKRTYYGNSDSFYSGDGERQDSRVEDPVVVR